MIKLYFFPRISKQWEPRFKGNTNFSFETHFFFLPSVSFLPLIIISFFFFSSNLSPFHYSLTLLNRSPLREISNSKNSLYNKFLFRFLIPIFAPYDFPSPIYHFNRSISLPILPSTSKSPHTKHFDARANSQARSFTPVRPHPWKKRFSPVNTTAAHKEFTCNFRCGAAHSREKAVFQ